MSSSFSILVQSAGHPVRQVPFQSVIGPSYVTPTAGQIRRTVHESRAQGLASTVPFRVDYPVDRIAPAAADPDFVRAYSLH